MSPSFRLPFTKMHGLGNDFIVIDEFDSRIAAGVPEGVCTAKTAVKWCDRRFGVGADQILVVGKPRGSQADARMDIWNSDGTTAEMCGNGIRAIGLYLYDHAPSELKGRSSYRIETGAGVLEVFVIGREVRVNMGPPRVLAKQPEKIETPWGVLEFWEVSMGNPHAVFFVDSAQRLETLELEKLGPFIENHPRFPKRTNVEFVSVQGSDPGKGEIDVRVWERGAGITLACGTGACASAVATLHSGRARGPLKVNLPGGSLGLEWTGADVWMTGPAVEVFQGALSAY